MNDPPAPADPVARATILNHARRVRLAETTGLRPEDIDYRKLRAITAWRELAEAQRHVLEGRYADADEALGRAARTERSSPGGAKAAERIEAARARVRAKGAAAKPALPPLARAGQAADGVIIDHDGAEYRIRLDRDTVTVSGQDATLSAPAGNDQTWTARELAARLRATVHLLQEKPEMRKTRRADGRPETPADKRFFDERESGYDGPLNQDGRRPDMSNPREREAAEILERMRQHAARRPPAGDLPEGACRCGMPACRSGWPDDQAAHQPVTGRRAGGLLMLPSTDAQFLGVCAGLAVLLRDLAGQVTGWADGLADLNIPGRVVTPLLAAGQALTAAATSVTQAAAALDEGDLARARQAAARGLRITGQDPA